MTNPVIDGVADQRADQRAIDAVYQRRARQMARRADAETVSQTLPVLIFALGEERYAIELSA